MKDLFKPVEYVLEEPKTAAESKTETVDVEAVQKEMKEFHSEVSQLIQEIQIGHSDLHAPVQMKGTPLPSVVARMQAVPNKKNIDAFFEIALQDMGARFKKACEDIFKSGRFPNLNKVK